MPRNESKLSVGVQLQVLYAPNTTMAQRAKVVEKLLALQDKIVRQDGASSAFVGGFTAAEYKGHR